MLNTKNVMATIAVKDLAAARKFYEGKLGFKVTGQEEYGTVTYQAGGTQFLVYASEFAGTNRATVATFMVGKDIAAIVKNLKSAGIAFEHYDMPGITHDGDLHVAGDMKVAWFKDPEGNIIALASG